LGDAVEVIQKGLDDLADWQRYEATLVVQASKEFAQAEIRTYRKIHYQSAGKANVADALLNLAHKVRTGETFEDD
jgi:hypothetical protein